MNRHISCIIFSKILTLFLNYHLFKLNRRTRSKTYNYNIPYNIDNFINKNNDNASKSINIIEDDNKELSEVTEIIQINYSNSNNVQNDYKKEIIQQVKKHNFDYIDDENEIYNNPNLHSEEQDELVIPDGNYNLNNYV
ncbi:uncharacterized protein OCT59_029783 [Rhizophagus irregularis]|uniref:uncharacterized protein n=1 Tax=Rhizophagus irregularis TaxID=588596 RepID=UPI00331AD8C4|nr:hypothetical protein OCT59_029783 [Rhizophagus irregularis]